MSDETELDTICRVCLQSGSRLRLLFDKFEEQTFADIINECTKYQVTQHDQLPQNICADCAIAAVNAFKFKRKCEQSYCDLVARLQLPTEFKKDKFTSVHQSERSKQSEKTVQCVCEHCDEKLFSNKTLETQRIDQEGFQINRECCEKSFSHITCLQSHIAAFHTETDQHIVNDKQQKNIELHFPDDSIIFEGDNNTNSVNTSDNYVLGFINRIDSDEDDDKPLIVLQQLEKPERSVLENAIEQVFVEEHNKDDQIEQTSKTGNIVELSQNKQLFLDKNKEITFPCTMCNKIFKRSVLLHKHMNARHVLTDDITCTDCEKSFTHSSQFQRHRETKHKEKIHKCSICDKTFTTKVYLQRHITIHKKKRYVCKECTKNYVTKEELNAHMKAEGHDKPLLCPECGLRCKTSNILMVHMRRHKGEKPFKCKFCSKGFPRMDDLRIHEKYHTGEKSHFCETCGKGFQRKYNLTIHLRVHTGEKPYKCPHCPQAFAQGNDLKAHIRRHTGERFRCEHCGAAFLQGYQIRQHKLSEHGIREDPPTQRVAKFTSTEAQELQIRQNLQKELKSHSSNESNLAESNMSVVLDSLPIDINEAVSSASDVVRSLEMSDLSTIQFLKL